MSADKLQKEAASISPPVEVILPSKTQLSVGAVLSLYTDPCQPGPCMHKCLSPDPF